MNRELEFLLVNDNTYEIVDKKGRADITDVKNDISNNIIPSINQVAQQTADVAVIAGRAETRAEQAFQSASSGKSIIAGSITQKGVETSPTATFQQMADNILLIPTGGDIEESAWKLSGNVTGYFHHSFPYHYIDRSSTASQGLGLTTFDSFNIDTSTDSVEIGIKLKYTEANHYGFPIITTAAETTTSNKGFGLGYSKDTNTFVLSYYDESDVWAKMNSRVFGYNQDEWLYIKLKQENNLINVWISYDGVEWDNIMSNIPCHNWVYTGTWNLSTAGNNYVINASAASVSDMRYSYIKKNGQIIWGNEIVKND